MAETKPIQVYGCIFTPEQEKERAKWHKTTYLEWEIPQKLSKKLNDIIRKEIKEFEKKCKCGLCKLHTKRKK